MAGEILAQLPEDLRTNEAFTGMNTAGDLATAFLDSQGKLKEFDGKVKDYDGKISDLSKNLEKYQAEVPKDPKDYEIPEVDGVPNDPNMVEWARGVFGELGIPKGMAKELASRWNSFQAGLIKSMEADSQKQAKLAEDTLRKQYGDKFDDVKVLADRVWEKHLAPEFKGVLSTTILKDGTTLGNFPPLTMLLFKIAQLTGESTTAPGSPGTGKKEESKGFTYPNSPPPPKNL
jgi:hypothetical protein